MTTETVPPQPQPLTSIGSLDEVLNFTDEDLQANRAGHLSDAQIERLRAGWRRYLIVGIIALIVIGFFAVLLIFQGQRGESDVLVFIGFALTLINAAIMGLIGQAYIRLSRDLRASSLITTCGTVVHTVKIYNRAATYLLDIEGERLLVPKPVFFAFEDKVPYALYRTAGSKTLLSAERL